mgnify:CR=1 FL=1
MIILDIGSPTTPTKLVLASSTNHFVTTFGTFDGHTAFGTGFEIGGIFLKVLEIELLFFDAVVFGFGGSCFWSFFVLVF